MHLLLILFSWENWLSKEEGPSAITPHPTPADYIVGTRQLIYRGVWIFLRAIYAINSEEPGFLPRHAMYFRQQSHHDEPMFGDGKLLAYFRVEDSKYEAAIEKYEDHRDYHYNKYRAWRKSSRLRHRRQKLSEKTNDRHYDDKIIMRD